MLRRCSRVGVCACGCVYVCQCVCERERERLILFNYRCLCKYLLFNAVRIICCVRFVYFSAFVAVLLVYSISYCAP